MKCDFRKATIEEITTIKIQCSKCGEEVESCDDCYDELDVWDKVFCDGFSHLCKECYIKRKKISNEYKQYFKQKKEGI